jgi:hypothetical protein
MVSMTILFDIEGTGADTFINQVTAVGIKSLGGEPTLWVRRCDDAGDGTLVMESELTFLERCLPPLLEMMEAHRGEPIVTWNGAYDFNFLAAKCLQHDIPLGDRISVARKRHFDLKRLFVETMVNPGQGASDSNVLEHLLVGREQQGRENLLCILWFMEGRTDDIARHLTADLVGLEDLLRRLAKVFPRSVASLVGKDSEVPRRA